MVIIRLLHVIDWHRGESVYTRKVLGFYLSFLGKGCLGERGEYGIWALWGTKKIRWLLK